MLIVPLLHHLNHITCLLSRKNPFAMHFSPALQSSLVSYEYNFFSRKPSFAPSLLLLPSKCTYLKWNFLDPFVWGVLWQYKGNNGRSSLLNCPSTHNVPKKHATPSQLILLTFRKNWSLSKVQKLVLFMQSPQS